MWHPDPSNQTRISTQLDELYLGNYLQFQTDSFPFKLQGLKGLQLKVHETWA